MPMRPPIHRAPGTHRAAQPAALERPRPSAAARGYDRTWREYRAAYLADPAHALCRRCLEDGRATEATVVDHVRPHRGDLALFWDPANHQPLCKPCHDSKTAREDGGFQT